MPRSEGLQGCTLVGGSSSSRYRTSEYQPLGMRTRMQHRTEPARFVALDQAHPQRGSAHVGVVLRGSRVL